MPDFAPSIPRTVGILGGMGPEATILLMSRIVALTPAQDDADHVPLLVDQNPQVPSRIAALIERTGEDPAPVLAAMARRLHAAGATALAMPCNTSHAYLSTIRDAVPLPVLDMVALAAEQLAHTLPANARVGLLASPAVSALQLYDRALAHHGLQTLHATSPHDLLTAIRRLKRNARDPEARALHHHAAQQLTDAGADALVIACTEFSLIADAVPDDVPTTDALDTLAEAIVSFAKGDC